MTQQPNTFQIEITFRKDQGRASATKVIPKVGITRLYDTFVLTRTLVFQINGCAKMPPTLAIANPYTHC